MDEARHLRDEALDWSIRLREQGEQSRPALEAWIARSPAHARAWAQVEQGWAMMTALGPMHRDAWPQVLQPSVTRRLLPRRAATAAFGLAACLALMVAAPALWTWARADVATGTGDIRQLALTDGSRLHLDSGSAVSLSRDAGGRGITLLKGQAFFQVAHDSAHPFAVQAGTVRITDLGTAFNVRLEKDTVMIAVQSGAVQITTKETSPLTLRPGNLAVVRQSNGQAVLSHIAPGRIAAWRDGQIIVNGATVAEVAAELGRYHHGFILIRNAELGRRRITGTYDLTHVDAALRAIIHPYGGHITTIAGALLIVS